MTSIAERIAVVQSRIGLACEFSGRDPRDVQLLAVSKGQPAEAIREAAAAGQRAFGENYLVEALVKIEALRELELEWHFIGPIQSNKTRRLTEHFSWAHSVDRLKVAERLSEQRAAGGPALSVCVQVNISGEKSKAGVTPTEAEALCRAVAALPRLKLRGLMVIPAPSADKEAQRSAYAATRSLFRELLDSGLVLDSLSMGMSADLDSAIAEGATIVRVGTDIFGPRPE
ncbi:MAG: YggS family pyridoxal phosphate-dependent enzyme [Nevskiales bacterium]